MIPSLRRPRFSKAASVATFLASLCVFAGLAGAQERRQQGTTALRLIESAARSGRVEPWRGETDIFIYPGFAFHAADGLMTNFHLPKSTLLMLVSALMGSEVIRAAYDHAVAGRYRFFSYGDASLLLPKG